MKKVDATVSSLVSMIESGELRLPEMQRGYVWKASRVRDLLDSLYRDYPSGMILVWETDRQMPSRDLAVAQPDNPFKGHRLLLDGQQRLTSLTAILQGKPVHVRGRKRAIEILFNLDHPEDEVEVLEVEDEPEEEESATNRRLSATPASQYLQQIVREHGGGELDAHCIPNDPALWETQSYPQFLAARRELLAGAINALISGESSAQSTRSVEEILASGESETVEFKSSARWDYKAQKQNRELEAVIVKTVAGFLNRDGGILMIGVDDSGTVLGLERDYSTLSTRKDRDGYYQLLVNLFSSTFGKGLVPSYLSIAFDRVSGREVCMITVKRAGAPVFVGEGQQKRLYVRSGNTTQELNISETVQYVKANWAG